MTIQLKATARIRAAKGAKEVKGVNELPKFRYLDDAMRFVESLSKEIDELTQVVKVQQRLLAKTMFVKKPITAAMEFDLTAPRGAPKSHLKYKIDPTLTKVEIPDKQKLASQYNLMEELYEKHRTLEMAENQIKAQFAKENRGEAFDAAIAGIRQLKDKIDKAMKETFQFLNKVASDHVPKEFMKYRTAVCQEIEKHVPFESNDQFLYVSVDDAGNIVFTNYVMLINAANEDGQIAPHLYISIQWIVGGKVTVQVNHEFEAPAQLLREGGEVVSSVSEAVRAISHLLELEDFATSLGTVPLAVMLKMEPGQIDLKRFEYNTFIDKVRVDEGAITFIMRPEAEKLYQQIAYQLFEELKVMVRNSRTARWRMDLRKKPTEITFVLKSAAQEGEVSIYDAEWMRSKFGISDGQLRKIVHVINHGG